MTPYERGETVSLMPGMSSSSLAESCVQVPPQHACGSSPHDKNKGDKDQSPSSIVNSSNKALQLLTLVQLNTEMSSWSDRYEKEESNVRIQKLRRNKRRAEKGICEVQRTIETLQEENKKLRTQNQKLVAREAEYAKMMRKASELLDSIHGSENTSRENIGSNLIYYEDASSKSIIIGERRDDDCSRIERDSLASFESSLLQKKTIYNQSTNRFLIDEKERVIEEMSTSIEAMEMQIEELKQEKEELLAQSEAQNEKIASLQEQDELKVAKIDILESMVQKMVQSLLKQEQGNDGSSSGALLAQFQLPWVKQEEKDCLSHILKTRRRIQHKKDGYAEDNVASSLDPPGKNDANHTDSTKAIVMVQKTTMKEEPESYRESMRERFFPSRNHIELVRTSKNPQGGGNSESSTTDSSIKSTDCESLVTCSLASTTKDGTSYTKETPRTNIGGMLISKGPVSDDKSESSTASSQTTLDFTLSDTETSPPSISSTNDATNSPSDREEEKSIYDHGIECAVDRVQRQCLNNPYVTHPHNTDTPPTDEKSETGKKDMLSGDDANQQSALRSPNIDKLCTFDIAAALQTIDKQIVSAKNELRSIRATKKTASHEEKERKVLQRKHVDKSDDATTKKHIINSNERPKTLVITSSHCDNIEPIVGYKTESTEKAGNVNLMQEPSEKAEEDKVVQDSIVLKSEKADDVMLVQNAIVTKSIECQATTVQAKMRDPQTEARVIPSPQTKSILQPPSYRERRFSIQRFRLAKQEVDDLKRRAAMETRLSALSSENGNLSKKEQGDDSNTTAEAPTCINSSCERGSENDVVVIDKKVLRSTDAQDCLNLSTKGSVIEVTCEPTEKVVETALVKRHDVSLKTPAVTEVPTKRSQTLVSSVARSRFNNRRFYKRKTKQGKMTSMSEDAV